jgi:hypothetical protein
MDYIEQ